MNPLLRFALREMDSKCQVRETRMEAGHRVPDDVQEYLDVPFQGAGGAPLAVDVFLAKSPEPVRKYLGITLLPQAGVALGMCATAYRVLGGLEGTLIRNIVLFSVLVYELVGPSLTKMALTKAGDIQAKSPEMLSRRQRRLNEITKPVPPAFDK